MAPSQVPAPPAQRRAAELINRDVDAEPTLSVVPSDPSGVPDAVTLTVPVTPSADSSLIASLSSEFLPPDGQGPTSTFNVPPDTTTPATSGKPVDEVSTPSSVIVAPPASSEASSPNSNPKTSEGVAVSDTSRTRQSESQATAAAQESGVLPPEDTPIREDLTTSLVTTTIQGSTLVYPTTVYIDDPLVNHNKPVDPETGTSLVPIASAKGLFKRPGAAAGVVIASGLALAAIVSIIVIVWRHCQQSRRFTPSRQRQRDSYAYGSAGSTRRTRQTPYSDDSSSWAPFNGQWDRRQQNGNRSPSPLPRSSVDTLSVYAYENPGLGMIQQGPPFAVPPYTPNMLQGAERSSSSFEAVALASGSSSHANRSPSPPGPPTAVIQDPFSDAHSTREGGTSNSSSHDHTSLFLSHASSSTGISRDTSHQHSHVSPAWNPSPALSGVTKSNFKPSKPPLLHRLPKQPVHPESGDSSDHSLRGQQSPSKPTDTKLRNPFEDEEYSPVSLVALNPDSPLTAEVRRSLLRDATGKDLSNPQPLLETAAEMNPTKGRLNRVPGSLYTVSELSRFSLTRPSPTNPDGTPRIIITEPDRSSSSHMTGSDEDLFYYDRRWPDHGGSIQNDSGSEAALPDHVGIAR